MQGLRAWRREGESVLKRIVSAAVVILCALGTPAWAVECDFDQAVADYDAGRFAAAIMGFRVCAEQGHATAQSRLGWMYLSGEGVPQDNGEAVRWYQLAAEQGDAYAQFHLGMMYAMGKGVPKDYGEAVRWFRRAAE